MERPQPKCVFDDLRVNRTENFPKHDDEFGDFGEDEVMITTMDVSERCVLELRRKSSRADIVRHDRPPHLQLTI